MELKEQTIQSLESKSPPRWWIWPAIVVGLMVLQICLSLTTLYFAMTDRSFAVEPSYYSRSLNWDSKTSAPHSNQGARWSFDLTFEERDSVLGQSTVIVDIREESGKRVSDAELSVIAFHHSNTKLLQRVAMVPTEIGEYRGKLTMEKKGLWQFQISARRGDTVCDSVQTVDIGGQGD